MATNSNGQATYLILESLSSGSKYGLEIIEHISNKTGGNYILKKPTLYSSLTRMEKKGYISSSYWGESELGGKRHYYSITAEGRKNLELLAKEFENISYQNQETSSTQETYSQQTEEPQNRPVFLKQNNLFDLVNNSTQTIETEEEKTNTPSAIENQMDIFSMTTQNSYSQDNNEDADNSPATEEEKKENEELKPSPLAELLNKINATQSAPVEEEKTEAKETTNIEETAKTSNDDGKFLENEERLVLSPLQEAQNQRLYDTSAELKKYKKKKSFSENQIEMAVVYEKQEDIAIQKARIEQLKQSILNLKTANQNAKVELNNNFEQKDEKTRFAEKTQTSRIENVEPSTHSTAEETKDITTQSPPPKEEEIEKDDGVFVTDRMDANEIPIQKKILPTNIEVNIYDDNLPAPKRNTNLEPTYKDMMAKLFERKKEKELGREQEAKQKPIIEEQPQMDSFADYNSLQKYYTLQGISFKEYQKTTVSRRHNTNFLKFISSSIMFLLSSIASAVLFAIISSVGLLQQGTNFMFYTIPLIFFVFAITEFIKHKVCISKKPSLLYNSIVNWAIFILGTLVVFVVNITCGMQYEIIPQYLTSLLLPTLAILIAFPINYYIKKSLYKKFGK